MDNGMSAKVEQEWKDVLAVDRIYIYGARHTAEHLYALIASLGFEAHVNGFVVTVNKDDTKSLLGLPVLEINLLSDPSARILVPHTGKYKREIEETLKKLEFDNVVYVSEMMVRSNFDDNPLLDIGRDVYDAKSDEEKDKDGRIREEIYDLLVKDTPYFGASEPYQSLECIGLRGTRPTSYRIQEYGILDYLKPDMSVLDIGCNTSFIDLSVAKYVKSVLGIEYEKALSKIAALVRDYLHIENAAVWNGDFNDWYKDDMNRSFDVIFSFAIHHWISLTAEEYTGRLDNLLNEGGLLVFESHLGKADKVYHECLDIMRSKGWKILKESDIEDMPGGRREYAIVCKEKAC